MPMKVRSHTHASVFDVIPAHAFQENLESLIRLGQDDPYVLEAMLQFMYKSSYDNDNDTTPKRRPAIVFAVQVYAMADKYQVDELKAYTLAKFISLAQEEWDQDFFCEALRLIYNNEMFPQHDQAMHEAAFEQILRHPVQLIRSKSFMSMIDEVGGIASRLSKELCSDMLGYKCEECGKVALVGPCLDLSHEHQTYYRCGMKCTWSEYTQVQGDETRSNGKVHGEHRY